MSRVAILLASRNRRDLVERFGDWAARNVKTDADLYVVECGSEPDQIGPRSTLAYADPDFLGKCFGHNVLLRHALARGSYDAWWVVMNDVLFDEGIDPLAPLLDALDRQPRLALVSPTEEGGHYPEADRRQGGGVRPVTTCDYLGFLLRDAALKDAGFLNPAFRYCWGAIHELSFQLHRRGWWLAYSDDVSYRHLGGSTYGAARTRTIPREEYQRRARRFAYPYFLRMYGPDWERRFFAAARPFGARFDTYAHHRAYWASAFAPAELAQLERAVAEAAARPVRAGVAAGVEAAGDAGEARAWLGLAGNPCALGPQHERLLARVQASECRAPVVEPMATAPARAVPPAPMPAASPAAPPAARPRDWMAACFTPDDLAPLPAGWKTGPPDFVGLGCGKAGGSWWYDLLLEHPQVVRNRLDAKELHYFCHFDFRGPDAAAVDLYREAFARPVGKLCGEWSGNFLNHPLSLGYLLDAAPEAKLLAIVRNPVDRAVSTWNQLRSARAPRLGLEGERARLLDDYSLFPEAIWSAQIAGAVRQLLDRVPRERLLVLQYEQLRDDPAPGFARTCEFLGIDAAFRPRDLRRAVNRRPYVVPRPDAAGRARLAGWFADDVRALASLLPGLDLALWPDFAALAPARSGAADVARLLASGRPRRLLLGCGQRPDPGAINVDLDPAAKADLRLDATDLSAFPDRCVDEIRSYHLFEHLTRNQARAALREWRRVLRPGGTLLIECPNLAVCVREVGRHFDPAGEDLAMIGIYGEPSAADRPPYRHHWGWSPETLAAELVAAGFRDPQAHPVEQTWRRAARFGRDLQLRARG